MTQTATRTSAKPAASIGTVTELEVGRVGAGILNKLANARLARLLAEKAEGPLKDRVKAMFAQEAEALKPGDVLVIKASGNVRGKVTMKRRAPAVDLKLLKEAFPEAYEKCVDDEVFSPQFDPA
jgi:hypothetical protein